MPPRFFGLESLGVVRSVVAVDLFFVVDPSVVAALLEPLLVATGEAGKKGSAEGCFILCLVL